MWGYRPYDPTINPAENWFVSFFAMGEGWHNWHHKYPSDYATSEYGLLKRINPTKAFIDLMAMLGLVWDRKRSTATWALAKARMAQSASQSIGSTISEKAEVNKYSVF